MRNHISGGLATYPAYIRKPWTMGFLALASPHHRRYCTHSFTSSPALSNVNFTTMFTFTKTSAICVLFALLGLKSVQGAPIDLTGLTSMIESLLDNLPDETSTVAKFATDSTSDAQTDAVSDTEATPSAPSIFTIVTSVGGPAVTLAQSGVTTVWNDATYTIDADAAAATNAANSSDSANTESDSASDTASDTDSATDSASGASGSVSASASTTASASSAASSGASSVSSASSSAKSSGTGKPNSSTGLRPVEISTPIARGLFTVAVGIVFGAWCL